MKQRRRAIQLPPKPNNELPTKHTKNTKHITSIPGNFVHFMCFVGSYGLGKILAEIVGLVERHCKNRVGALINARTATITTAVLDVRSSGEGRPKRALARWHRQTRGSTVPHCGHCHADGSAAERVIFVSQVGHEGVM